MRTTVVIGGGIAGIVAAYRLASHGSKVILVERAKSLGGLLRSRSINGKFFDYGSHLLSKTGLVDLDSFLFDGLDTIDLTSLSVGSFNRTLHADSSFLHDFGFSDDDRTLFLKSYLELDKIIQQTHLFSNLSEQLTSTFGRVIYERLLCPTLSKFFHESPVNLAPDSHRLFGLNRIILGDPQTTRELKKNKFYDCDLAFHHHQEGISPNASLFYPLSGGVGAWISLLTSKLHSLNVDIVTSSQYSFSYSNDRISQIHLCGNTYDLDLVVSTIPSFNLHKILDPSSSLPRINSASLSTFLVHFEYQGEYLCDSLYIYNHDPRHHIFRVSLYGNYLYSLSSRTNHITVEFLVTESPASINQMCNYAVTEIEQMQLLTSPELLKVVGTDFIKTGFPVPKAKPLIDKQENSISIIPSISNLLTFGRSSGQSWFMSDVITQIDRALN